MKVQIRQGVFETNSSSEHSVSVVPEDDWMTWTSGKSVARIKRSTEGAGCWGNFWSNLDEWEFTTPGPGTKKENENILRTWIDKEISEIKQWCIDPEYDGGYDEYWKNRIDELSRWQMDMQEVDNHTRFFTGCWVTFEEYMDALRNGDCYSPFEHSVPEQKVHIFGTYFHS